MAAEIDFRPDAPDFLADPYPMYRRLREEVLRRALAGKAGADAAKPAKREAVLVWRIADRSGAGDAAR